MKIMFFENMQYLLLLLLLFVFYASATIVEDFPTVKIQHGSVIGHYRKSYNGRRFSAFEGIPYAKPPIGSLRFEEPQPVEPWLGNWIANRVYTCIQLYPNIIGDEDCLYINVYIPKEHSTSLDNLDVVAHIHGGGFVGANPELAGPEFLMDRDIIYVNFNYRLGAMGFLSTEDLIIKGNMGLKDQVMALKWIQNNIKHFGGNPRSVTLIGLSAGATSTQYHYLSPKSKGLFHRGISQSGTVLAPFSLQKGALRNAKALSSLVGCPTDSTRIMANCLRQRPASQITLQSENLLLHPVIRFAPLRPVIEKKSESAFLSDHPYYLLQKGYVNDLPWITSITTEEGIVGAMDFIELFDYIDKHWNEVAPLIFDYNYTYPDSKKDEVSEAIKKYYFQNKPLSEATTATFIKLFSDRYFILNFEKSALMQASVNKSPVYTYVYGYKEESIDADKILGFNGSYGVSHGSDGHLLYDTLLAGFQLSSKNLTKSDTVIKDFLVDMVVHFSKTGKPVEQINVWQRVDPFKCLAYLFIKNSQSIAMNHTDLAPSRAFWKSLKLKEDELWYLQ